MAHTTCLVCLFSTVSGCHKNILGRTSTSSGHITKFEQSTFPRYLCIQLTKELVILSQKCLMIFRKFTNLLSKLDHCCVVNNFLCVQERSSLQHGLNKLNLTKLIKYNLVLNLIQFFQSKCSHTCLLSWAILLLLNIFIFFVKIISLQKQFIQTNKIYETYFQENIFFFLKFKYFVKQVVPNQGKSFKLIDEICHGL